MLSNNINLSDMMSMTPDDLDELEGLLRQEEAHKGLMDLYYLDKYILGYADMEPKTHIPVCRFVTNGSLKKHIELPRGCFKSSVITIGYTIQSVARDPNIRILIDNEVYGNSKAFLREIKSHMENQEITALYPQLIPDKRTNDGWTESTVIVSSRTKIRKEPTISCAGLDQIKVGMHYDLIIMDDLVSKRNVTTREQMEKVIEHYKMALSLLEPKGTLIVVGTRYHYADLYGYLLKNEKDTFDHFIIPAKLKLDSARLLNQLCPDIVEEYGPYKKDDLIFPERLDDVFLKEQRRSQGSYIYNCQYMLEPVDAESSDFQVEWIKYYRGHIEKSPDSQEEILVIDWIGDHKKNTAEGYEFPMKKKIRKVITLDPNNKKKKTSDYTGGIVNAVTEDGDWFILDIERDILNPGEIVNKVFHLNDHYKPDLIGLEETGKEAIQFMLVQKMRKESRFFKYHELKTGGVAKEDRIKRLIPRFEYGTIFLPVSLVKTNSMKITTDLVEEFESEYMYFPSAEHDDLMDALAYQEDLCLILTKRDRSSGRKQGKAKAIASVSNLPRNQVRRRR